MSNVSQEGQVDVTIAQAVEQVFRALIDGCLQDMATGASEVRGRMCTCCKNTRPTNIQRPAQASLATGCKCA